MDYYGLLKVKKIMRLDKLLLIIDDHKLIIIKFSIK